MDLLGKDDWVVKMLLTCMIGSFDLRTVALGGSFHKAFTCSSLGFGWGPETGGVANLGIIA